MTISAILQLNRGFNLIISRGKFKIKRSKDRKNGTEQIHMLIILHHHIACILLFLQFTFSPNTLDAKSIDYFHVKAIGNISKTIIKCSGSSKGDLLD